MSRKNNTATSQNLTRLGAQCRVLANGNLTPEGLRQQAGALLPNKDLPRDILGLSAEDQAKFVDKVDQVCRDFSFFFFAGP